MKQLGADDSAATSVKVGYRQASYKRKPADCVSGLFCFWSRCDHGYTGALIFCQETMRALVLLLGLLPALASAHPTPEQAVATLWQALSHDPGVAADGALLKRIFHDDAVVFGGRYQDGQARFSATRASDFIAAQSRVRPYGFYECEVAREVKVYDRFASVYSVVESRRDKQAAKADFVGVNSLQLYKDDQGWKIVSLYYQVEKPGLPVPLGAGTTGVCID